MPSDFTNEFFRWLYTSEIEHKDRLDSADGLLVGALTLLSTVGIYYLKIFPVEGDGWLILSFRLLAALYAICFGIGVVSGVMSLWPRIRAFIGSPQDIDEYVTGIEKYHRYHHTDDDSINNLVDKDLQEFLREQFVEAAKVNRELTLTKSKWQVRVKYAVAAAIVAITVNAYPTFEVQQTHSEIQKVDLIELRNDQEVRIIPAVTEGYENGRPATKPKTTTVAPAK